MLGNELIQEYLESCERERRLDVKTVRAYSCDLGQYRDWHEKAGESPGAFSKESVRAYLAHLNERYAPSSTRRKMAAIRAFMSFLRDEGHIDASPFDGLKLRTREPRRLPRTIPVADMNRLFNYMGKRGEDGPTGSKLQVARDRTMLEMLIATGMRVSELCSLDLDDLDLAGKTVRIAGKGDKERIVHLEDERTLEALRTYLELRKEQETHAATDALFLNRSGTRMSDRAVRDVIRRRCEEAGLDVHVTPHMFRHTFATWLLERDVDIRYIQKLLGHSSLRTTEIYTHVTSAKLREILRDSNPRGMINA